MKRKCRKIIRLLIRLIPVAARAPLARRFVKPNFGETEKLVVQVAQGLGDVKQALGLIHDCYVDQGLMSPRASGMRVSLFNLYPTTTTIIARANGQVVGTLSILVKNNLDLPSDHDFSTRKIQPTNGRTAEIVGLAIKKSNRGNQGDVLFSLMKYMYMLCRNHLNVNVLQVAVSPAHAYLYRDLLLFKYVEKKVVLDQSVNGKKMKALFLNLDEAPRDLKQAYGRLPWENNLFYYMTEFKHEGFVAPPIGSRGVSAIPSLTKGDVVALYNMCSDFMFSLSQDELAQVRSIYQYSDNELTKDLPKLRLPLKSFAVCMECPEKSFLVLDATEDGLRLVGEQYFQVGHDYQLRVRTPGADSSNAKVKVSCVWVKGDAAGFKLVHQSPKWSSYIQAAKAELIGANEHSIYELGVSNV